MLGNQAARPLLGLFPDPKVVHTVVPTVHGVLGHRGGEGDAVGSLQQKCQSLSLTLYSHGRSSHPCRQMRSLRLGEEKGSKTLGSLSSGTSADQH